MGRFTRDEHGSSIPEYAIVVALIAVIVTSAISSRGPSLLFGRIHNDLNFAKLDPASAPPSMDRATETATPPPVPRSSYGALASVLAITVMVIFTRWLQAERRLRQLPQTPSNDEAVPEALQARIFQKRQAIYSMLDSDSTMLLNTRLEVGHLLTTLPFFVPAAATKEEVCNLMSERKVRHLLVGTPEKLLGVISDRDASRIGLNASEMMTPNPITVSTTTPISRAISTLLTHGFSCLPVLTDDKVVGILTTTDLVLTLQCSLRILEQLRNLVHEELGQTSDNSGDERRDELDARLTA